MSQVLQPGTQSLSSALIWPMVVAKARGHANAGAPVLTAYDQGARTELSALTLSNAVAKAANALVDEADIEPGDLVAVDLPWHWQRCVWLLACWSAGATVHLGRDPEQARLQLVGPSIEAPVSQSTNTWAVSLHPLGMPLAELPAGVEDAALMARAGGDDFFAPEVVGPALADHTRPVITQQEAVARVQHEVTQRSPATRLLIAGEPADGVLAALVLAIAPVLPGTSIVVSESMSEEQLRQRADQESATPW